MSLAHSLFSEAIPIWDLWCQLLDRDVDLEVMEDNQATIKVARAGFSAKLRHVQRTHAVNLSSLKEVLRFDGVSIEYVDTKDQTADVFTKALAPQKWDNAMQLLGMATTPVPVIRAG